MRRLWMVGLALIAASLIGPALTGTGVNGPWTSEPTGLWGGMGEHHAWMHSGSAGVAAIPGARESIVVATEFGFDPEIISVTGPTNLTLVNKGAVLHDLTVPGLGIHLVVRPGGSATVGMPDLSVGEYRFFCSVPGHADAGMAGLLKVTG